MSNNALQSDLTLHCATQPAAIVEVMRVIRPPVLPGPMESMVQIETCDMTDVTNASTKVVLDKARARELFNWLGVWLHTV